MAVSMAAHALTLMAASHVIATMASKARDAKKVNTVILQSFSVVHTFRGQQP